MQGNLEQPPIIIYSSAQKSLALMVGCGLAAAMCWFDLSLSASATRAASGLVAFGLGMVYCAWLFLSPNVLTLSPAGLILQTRWRNARWSWDQVSHFRALRVHIASSYIGFDLAEQSSEPVSFTQYYVRYAGANDSLGGGWEIGARQLADLLNSARAHWRAVQ
jgi:hypothetical protein